MAESVGLILTGGSLRGLAAEVGALRALDEAGFRFDAAIGTSAGAIASAVYASGRRGSELADTFRGLTSGDYLDPDLLGTVRAPFRRFRGWHGILRGEALLRWLRRHLPAHDRIEQCPLPLHLVVTNVSRGVPQVKSEGPLAELVRGSAATPLVFRLQQVDGEWYSDGGAVANIPLDDFIELYPAFDRYLIVTALRVERPEPEPDNAFLDQPWTPFRLLERIAEAVAAAQHQENLEAAGREVKVLRVRVPSIGLTEIGRFGEAMDAAYDDARRQIDSGTVDLSGIARSAPPDR